MGKKIVFLIYTLTPTGGLKVLFKIGNKLKESGYDVEFYVAENLADYPLQYQNSCKIVGANGNVLNTFFSRLAYLFNAQIKADVIVATYFPTAIAAYFNKNIAGKLLYYVQADETHFFSFRLLTLVRRFHYFLFAHVSYLIPIRKIVNCAGSTASLSKRNNYPVIPPGFDPIIYNPSKKGVNTVLKIGHISRVERRKGSLEFFEAMKLLREEGLDFEILIAYDFCKETAQVDYEKCKPKSESELADFYSSCDIIISTVWEKGFAYPPLETMACGSISISTPIDYGKEWHDHVPIAVNNASAIKEAVLWIVNNPLEAEKIRQNGIATSHKYTWDFIVESWIKEIEK
jgi:glycosyltransferase involved in cell wall biosynthesis